MSFGKWLRFCEDTISDREKSYFFELSPLEEIQRYWKDNASLFDLKIYMELYSIKNSEYPENYYLYKGEKRYNEIRRLLILLLSSFYRIESLFVDYLFSQRRRNFLSLTDFIVTLLLQNLSSDDGEKFLYIEDLFILKLQELDDEELISLVDDVFRDFEFDASITEESYAIDLRPYSRKDDDGDTYNLFCTRIGRWLVSELLNRNTSIRKMFLSLQTINDGGVLYIDKINILRFAYSSFHFCENECEFPPSDCQLFPQNYKDYIIRKKEWRKWLMDKVKKGDFFPFLKRDLKRCFSSLFKEKRYCFIIAKEIILPSFSRRVDKYS